MFSPDKKEVLAVNGEIYNHQNIRKTYSNYSFQTGSDCEVILALYRDWKAKGKNPAELPALIEQFSGIFAFALYDVEDDCFLIARDTIGVIPLYIGYDNDGKVYVASELKALEGQCDSYEPFLPGHYVYSERKDACTKPEMKKYYSRKWMTETPVPKQKAETKAEKEYKEKSAVEDIREKLINDAITLGRQALLLIWLPVRLCRHV